MNDRLASRRSASSATVNLLGMFAKYWQPGRVKTRLAESLGAAAASDLYRQFVSTLARRLERCGDRRVLAFSPPQRRRAFADLVGSRWQLQAQHGNDLGQRMQHFFGQLTRADQRVVLIGSDSPTLPVQYIDDAFAALESHAVVLGPSGDGGYYLIGAAGGVPPVFEGVPWSTEEVWPVTVERLRRRGTPFACLPEWYDVDDMVDLQRLDAELRAHAAPPDTAGLRAAVASALQGRGPCTTA